METISFHFLILSFISALVKMKANEFVPACRQAGQQGKRVRIFRKYNLLLFVRIIQLLKM